MPRLLVTGASGHLGRAVIESLLSSGQPVANIVAGSRHPEKLADLAARGVEARAIDFDDPNLAARLAGIDHLLIISTDALDDKGTRLAQHKKAVAAAKAAGVGYVVYTSMPNPQDSVIPFAPDHLGTEQAIAASGLDHTILRNSWYMENLLGSLPSALASGNWYSASGDGRVANIARADCAAAAAAALVDRKSGGRIFTLTGPQTLTTAEMAAAASAATGKPLAVVPVTDQQLVEGMIGAGLPAPVAAIFATFDTNTRLGKVDLATGDVEKLTGRKPQTLAAFLAAHKAALGA